MASLRNRPLPLPCRRRVRARNKEMRPSTKNKQIGTVYFIQEHGHDGYIKVGFSTNIKDRLQDLGNASAHDIAVLLLVPDVNASWEKTVHTALKKSHYRGEWFYPTPNVYTFIQQIKEFLELNTRVIAEQYGGPEVTWDDFPPWLQAMTCREYIQDAIDATNKVWIQ